VFVVTTTIVEDGCDIIISVHANHAKNTLQIVLTIPPVPLDSPTGGLYPAARAYPLDALTNTAQTKPYSQPRLVAHDLHYRLRGKFPTLSARAPLFFVFYPQIRLREIRAHALCSARQREFAFGDSKQFVHRRLGDGD
jgi:hypothetical protein